MNFYKYVLFALILAEYLATMILARIKNPSAKAYAVITGYTALLLILIYNA